MGESCVCRSIEGWVGVLENWSFLGRVLGVCMDASECGIISWGGGLVEVLFSRWVDGVTHLGAGQMFISGGG